MRIDAHQHFWHYNPERDRWINDEMAALKRDFLPAQLIPELLAHDFRGCIAVQADQSEAETRFLLGLADRHEVIQGVVGWVDLCAVNVAERLDLLAGHRKLSGFRHIAQAEPDDRFLLREDFLRGVKCLGDFGFTYDILIYEKQLPAAIELAAKLPDQPFVLDHIAKPSIKDRRYLPWAHYLRTLAENPNVYCKVSGLVTEADWRGWLATDFSPYLDLVLEAFGPERLMFGSDWPVCLLAASYGQVVQVVEDYAAHLPAPDREKIFGLTAAHFYGQRAARCAITTGK
jgi:L-fuconolactonase